MLPAKGMTYVLASANVPSHYLQWVTALVEQRFMGFARIVWLNDAPGDLPNAAKQYVAKREGVVIFRTLGHGKYTVERDSFDWLCRRFEGELLTTWLHKQTEMAA